MATGGKDTPLQDPELWREQQRMYNFLQHYDLHKYYQRLMHMGVTRLSHFKDVTDGYLDAVGFSPPEKTRLRKKLEENFSTAGRIKKSLVGKGNRFDNPAPEQAYRPLDDDPTHQTASLIAKEEIKLEKKIGEGAHGSVYEGTWSNAHGSVIVAVKTLYGNDNVQSTFIKEADSMRALRHQHIVRLYGIVLSSPLMLIQELAPFGSLHEFLEKEGHTKDLHLFHTYATQIADAMKYLEEKRVVHRDLAARNILLAQENFVKLSDFGMARILDEHTDVYNLSNLQSRIPIAWTALEALTRAKFSTASDVWSFGVTLWEIYSLCAIPWKGLTPIEIRDILMRGERLGRPERCPTEMHQIMLTCWESRPQDRPTFTSLHKRLLRSHPPQVRAVQSHTVVEDDDSSCISFKKGELIYLIDRPKPGWMFGMIQGGKIGYFLADHVTNVIDPIGDIKEKLQTGKAKVTDLPISGPSQVSHECHWGQDGKKWGNPEEELKGHQQSPKPASRSVKSPPFRIVNNSPRHSPLQKKRSAPLNGENAANRHSPAHNDGRVASQSSQSGSETCSPTALSPTSPSRGTIPEHNQYITMKRAGLLVSPVHKQPHMEGGEGEGLGEDPEDKDDYLLMSPNPSGLFTAHTYQNIVSSGLLPGQYRKAMDEAAYVTPRPRVQNDLLGMHSGTSPGQYRETAEEVEYMTPRSRDELLSIQSNSSTGSTSVQDQHREHSRLRQHHSASPPALPGDHPLQNEMTKRSLTLPSTSARVRSQYSYVTEVSDISSTTALSSTTPQATVSTAVGVPQPIEEQRSPVSGHSNGSPRFPLKMSSLGDLEVAMRGGTDSRDQLQSLQPAMRPRPRPRPKPRDRVVSMPSPELSSKHQHNPRPISPDYALSDAVRGITLNGAHHPHSHISQETIPEESDREPLIPIEAPPVPKRTYLSPTHKVGPVTPIHAHPENNILQKEFPDTPPELCQRALENYGYDVDKAREEIQIQILLGMNIPHTKAEDCKRALKHCQWKIDRAAGWLVERSEELENKRT